MTARLASLPRFQSPTVLPPQADTIALIGLGREGDSSYRWLRERYPAVRWLLLDDAAPDQLAAEWRQRATQPSHRLLRLAALSSVKTELATAGDLGTLLVVKTPGIPLEQPTVTYLLEQGGVLLSNTSLFFNVVSQLTNPPLTIGVTGTKGKSTTTALIHHVLKSVGLPVALAGNIGVPPLEALREIESLRALRAVENRPTVILELSSHQLRELQQSPNLAVVLDITPEHLDYYENFSEYLTAKASICRYQQPGDSVLINPNLAAPLEVANQGLAEQWYFGVGQTTQRANDQQVVANLAYLEGNVLYYDGQPVIETAKIPLMGQHNYLNALPSILISCKQFGLSAAAVASAIQTFTALPHRLEYVTTVNDVEYYNDSQATTPEAAIAALQGFAGRPIVLIAGGSDKGVSFDELGKIIIQAKVTTLLHFPPMGAKIAQAVERAAAAAQATPPAMDEVTSMPAAVQAAAAAAQPGGVVLLSPACASFGIFKNYQDRGDQFKGEALALAKSS